MPATRKLFVNLPVKELGRTVEFFTRLGFSFNPQFTDENATCMLVGEDAYVMLLVEPFFQGFSKRELPDTSRTSQVLVAVMLDAREDVDRLMDIAVSGGAVEFRPPQNIGFMYGRAFADLDGHQWEFGWMDPGHVQPAG